MIDINDSAFYNSGITEITIEDKVNLIGNAAFGNCKQLSTVTIGLGIASFMTNVFEGCDNLTDLNYNAISAYYYHYNYKTQSSPPLFPPSLKNLKIGDYVTVIPDYAFKNCHQLETVVFPNSLIEIGGYAFSYCNGIKSIVFPNSLEIIGNYVFTMCENLQSVEISASVKTIGYVPFQNCTKLKSITCKAITPPTAKYYLCYANYYNPLNVWYVDGEGNFVVLYVPTSSSHLYRNAQYWMSFYHIRNI